MKDSKNNKSAVSGTKQGQGRRDVVKGVALGLGGMTLSQWSKPVVETIVLPAHAQTSPGGMITQPGSGSGTFDF